MAATTCGIHRLGRPMPRDTAKLFPSKQARLSLTDGLHCGEWALDNCADSGVCGSASLDLESILGFNAVNVGEISVIAIGQVIDDRFLVAGVCSEDGGMGSILHVVDQIERTPTAN